MKINKSSSFFILICALIFTLLWGSAFPCVKIGYELFSITNSDSSDKILFAGIRFFLAGLILLFCISCYYLIKKSSPVCTIKMDFSSEGITDIIFVCLFQTFLQYIFFYLGLSMTTGTKGSIINSCSSFFMVICACIFFKDERLTFRKITGCILGLSGIILINYGSFSNNSFNIKSTKGELLLILASLSFTAGTLYSKKAASLINPFRLTAYQLFIGGLLMVITGLIMGGRLSLTIPGLLMIIYLALISAVAFSLWTMLLKYNDASKIAVYNFLTPIFGVILSGLILHESFLSATTLISLLLVSVGIVIITNN